MKKPSPPVACRRKRAINMSSAVTQMRTPNARCRAASRSGCLPTQLRTSRNAPTTIANGAIMSVIIFKYLVTYRERPIACLSFGPAACQLPLRIPRTFRPALRPGLAGRAHRFCLHGEGYFRFITHPEIQPTNTSAEQAMRFVVMDRRRTQGTRSQRGREFCERLWTVIATCWLQKRSAYEAIHAAIRTRFNGRPVPSLLLDSS